MADRIVAVPGIAPEGVSGQLAGLERVRSARLPVIPRTVALSLVWVGIVIVLAVLEAAVTPHDRLEQNLGARNVPPVWLDGGSWNHVFGTDQNGHDIPSRVMVSVRPTLLIGALASLIALVSGTVLGLIVGYFRGTADGLIMLLADSQLTIPSLVIAIAAVAAFGQSIALQIILAGLSGCPDGTRERPDNPEPGVRHRNPGAGSGGCPYPPPPYPAEHRLVRDRPDHHPIPVPDPVRGGPQLPRTRRAAAATLLGGADRRRPRLPPQLLVDQCRPRDRADVDGSHGKSGR